MVKSYEAEVRQKQVIPANWAMHVLEGRGYQRAAKEDYWKGSLEPARETQDT